MTKLVSVLRKFPPSDAFRADLTSKLLRKLYENGLTPSQGSLAQAEKLATSALCRRRLAVMLVRLKFCETLREATTFVEQGACVGVGARARAWACVWSRSRSRTRVARRLSTHAYAHTRSAHALRALTRTRTRTHTRARTPAGHVRVGPDTVRDPAFHVTRAFEDFITWNDQSKVRRQVLRYHDKLDDADLL